MICLLINLGDDFVKIGFIGGGNMGTALMSGFISSGKVKAEDIFVYDSFEPKLEELKNNLGIIPKNNAQELEEASDVVILAVKPNVMPFILEELKSNKDKLYISIAAGITLDTLSNALGADKKIVRVMPNTPALVGCGMSVISPNNNISPDENLIIENLFNGVGETVFLGENYMNAAIALHSSSPAYIYMLIDAMADSGVKYGIPKAAALKLAAKAVEGSAKMVLENNEHPMQLKDNVCSPGGTTIAAVCELENNGFRSSVQKAIDACVNKAESMSK